MHIAERHLHLPYRLIDIVRGFFQARGQRVYFCVDVVGCVANRDRGLAQVFSRNGQRIDGVLERLRASEVFYRVRGVSNRMRHSGEIDPIELGQRPHRALLNLLDCSRDSRNFLILPVIRVQTRFIGVPGWRSISIKSSPVRMLSTWSWARKPCFISWSSIAGSSIPTVIPLLTSWFSSSSNTTGR